MAHLAADVVVDLDDHDHSIILNLGNKRNR